MPYPYGNNYGYGGYGSVNGPVYRLPDGSYSGPMTPEQYTRTIGAKSAAALGYARGSATRSGKHQGVASGYR